MSCDETFVARYCFHSFALWPTGSIWGVAEGSGSAEAASAIGDVIGFEPAINPVWPITEQNLACEPLERLQCSENSLVFDDGFKAPPPPRTQGQRPGHLGGRIACVTKARSCIHLQGCMESHEA